MTRGKDPYWMSARFPGKCARCGKEIKKGEQIFYYPNTRAVYCDGDNCGGQEARDFAAAASDENIYNG
jgi:hypothetical protein